MTSLDDAYLRKLARMALDEDIGSGDITSLLTIPKQSTSEAIIMAKADGVLAGIRLAEVVFEEVDSSIGFSTKLSDGDKISIGDHIAKLSGSTRGILAGERVVLNFLQRTCGIATMARAYSQQVEGTKARVVDTRKTTPGLRRLEKYAVCVGGAYNHRFGLSDGVLIKDNHIAGAGGVAQAVEAAKRGAPHTLKIEVEVTNLQQLAEAIEAGADAALLDNMDAATLREAVKFAQGRLVLEASGGVNLKNIGEIATTGVDIISSGALTHSVAALDISLLILT